MDVHLTQEAFETLLARLYERGDRLEFRQEGTDYPRSEKVDAYVLSGHAEALLSDEFEGDLWGTLADIDEAAADEAEAWDKIKAFYLGRGHVLLHLGAGEEWIFEEALARRLGLV
ncbi:hypothetical protein [Deinococcus sp.]|uniref:hypothetical protein n=1 Tax=Deinococcus sp. TaxID=47478 RepID=UPI0025E94CED|nr:hypothetical protein [Deinococcus sp.]